MSLRPVLTAASGGAADTFGTHRSLEPRGSLPQPAQRLDNDMSRLFEGEMLIAVETLNIDAASFRQMEEAARGAGVGEGPEDPVAQAVVRTVASRGKQHNPVTGSGGMLLGRVLQLAPGRGPDEASVGDRVATLVSLSLTPLRIDRVKAVRHASAQIDVEGEAVLFASGAYAKLGADSAAGDLPERLALAALDVAGAAPQVARLVRRFAKSPAQGARAPSVLVLGAGGKSGVLCCAEARRSGGAGARVLGVESHPTFADELRALAVCDAVVGVDARDPMAVRRAVLAANDGREVDVSFSCVNVPDTEMAAILSTREGGVCYFFAMSTSFTRAALGAEGVGKDVELVIGNGFARGHATHTLEMIRSMPPVRELFAMRYG